MPESKRSPVLAAVDAVHAALKGLSPADRAKVLAAVAALIDIPAGEKGTLSGGQQSRPVRKMSPEASLPASSRPVSLIELVQDKQPSTKPQFIALFAYYREKYESEPRFARGDLEGYFAKARQTPPSNFDRDFAETVRRGWIHEEGADSYVTSRGIEAVEGGFPNERRRPDKAKAGKPKQRRGKRRRAQH